MNKIKPNKIKLNFWDDMETKVAILKQADKEDRDISGLIRSKIRKIRRLEKW